jgi:hypothetical protein
MKYDTAMASHFYLREDRLLPTFAALLAVYLKTLPLQYGDYQRTSKSATL